MADYLPKLPFGDAIHYRRSIYAVNKNLPIPASQVQQLCEDTAKHIPSAFNSQTTRMVLLMGGEHDKLWGSVSDHLEAELSSSDPEKWGRQKGRMDGFKKAAGTVLFFEDTKRVQEFAATAPQYAPLFPSWSEQTSGMHQLCMWTSLENSGDGGIGASLQHYNYDPKIETMIRETWNVPAEWVLKAQLVFGGLEGGKEGARPKEPKPKLPSNEVVKAYGV